MKRIIIHWTAGAYQPNATDYAHYHYLITGDGLVVKGKWNVSANEVCRNDAQGKPQYCVHTGGGNTGSIGVSMCGMCGFIDTNNVGKYPLTAKQVEACFKKVAELCKQYKIPITPDTVMTHYEFGRKNLKTTSAGKIDIIYLPPYPQVKKAEVGDFMRNKIKWYYSKL